MLNQPIIAIGAAGYLSNPNIANTIYLVIGEKDLYHYNAAKEFAAKSQNLPLHVNLIEHENGHVIPMQILENIITQQRHISISKE